MKLDRLKFATLIGYCANRGMTVDEVDVKVIDQLTDVDYQPIEVPGKADPAMINELMRAIHAGERIAAIKAYRSLTGFGLKESKDAVEKHWSTKIKRTRQELYKVLNSEVISPEKDDIISSFINRAY